MVPCRAGARPRSREPPALGRHGCTGCRRGRGERRLPLVAAEVAVDLPPAHLEVVLSHFLALSLEEALRQVLAEGILDDVVLLEVLQRLVKVPRELVDPVLPAVAVAHPKDVPG